MFSLLLAASAIIGFYVVRKVIRHFKAQHEMDVWIREWARVRKGLGHD